MVIFGNNGVWLFSFTSDINQAMRNILRSEHNREGGYANTLGGISIMRTQHLSSKDERFIPRAPRIAVITYEISTHDHDLT